MLHILCKRGSKSSRIVAEGVGINRCFWQNRDGSPRRATRLINWGVYGHTRQLFFRKYPYAQALPMVNFRWPGNKFIVIDELQHLDPPIPVPISTHDITQRHWTNTHWLYKPNLSAKGDGIFRINDNTAHQCDWSRGYAQQEIRDRRYEVRVTAFKWMSQESWGCWKKVCDDSSQLCWNFDKGGRFVRINDPLEYSLFTRCFDHSARALEALGLQYGAFDFIVDKEGREHFLEVNLQPGFTEDYGADLYINAVRTLNAFSLDAFNQLIRR